MSAPRKWLLSLAVLVAAILVPELLLRAVGFEHRSGVQFGFPDPKRMAFFAPDERLFWKLKPPADPAHVRADVDGNSHGFQGPDPAIPKPAGTYRVLYLGDSCTFQGYPWRAAERMRDLKVPADRTAETVSLAIPGYTSLQGLRAAQDYGVALDPDLVFVFFGWNDHWAAYGAIDSKKDLRPPARVATGLLETSRLVQATAWLLGRVGKAGRPLEETRVLPDEYRANLTAIAALFSARKVPVVFLTAPTTFYRLGVPQKTVDDHFAKSGEDAIRLHREYNAIVREVAAASGSRLLDLEKECESSPELEKWFLKDGIHFSPAGRDWVADRIARYVRDEVVGK
jgi:lysophospholipase L1-like esterase